MPEMILLRLEGIMQSWGENAKWETRTTSDFPTKSGIVGLIACSLGLKRNDPKIQQLSDSIILGIRADRKGKRMRDYQTIQGMPFLFTAKGEKRAGNNTLLSNRYYLNDASFMVVIQCADDKLRNEMIHGLLHPKWTVYLGRKACIPSKPVYFGTEEYADIMDAIKHAPYSDRCDQEILFEIDQIHCDDTDLSIYSRTDMYLGGRDFLKRSVYRGALKEKNGVSC